MLIEAAARFRQVITESADPPCPLAGTRGRRRIRLPAGSRAGGASAKPSPRTLLSSLATPRFRRSRRFPMSALRRHRPAAPTRKPSPPNSCATPASPCSKPAGRAQPCEIFDPQLRRAPTSAWPWRSISIRRWNGIRWMYVLPAQWWICTAVALVGFEALLRWRHPQFGLIQPSDFHSHRGKYRPDRSPGRLGSAPGRHAAENLAE